MINVNQITSQLAKMPDPALQQYAMLHKNDPYTVSLALSESTRRKQMRAAAQAQQGMGEQPKVVDQGIAEMMPPQPQMAQGQAQAMPEDLGIATLNAPNMETMAAAEGGIVGYADGGMVAFAKGGKPNTDAFESAFQTVLRLEGGAKFVADDAGKGPTKYGINQTANPDLDVKNLTEAQAREIYRKRYWDKINGDVLAAKNPALATIAFDAAVNQGTGPANKMVAAAGGDPAKLLEMRKQRYDALVQAKPEAYGQFSKGWDKRLASLATAAIPIGSAKAETEKTGIATVAPATSNAAVSQIPGGVPMEQAPAGPAPTGNDIVKGTAKTAFALGQNTLAVPAAGISTLARRAFGDPTANFEETLGRYSYSPDDAVSQQQLEGIGKAMRDLKIPAYMPMLGGVAGASRAGAAKDAAAIAKAAPLRLTNETAGTPQAIAAAAADTAKKSKAAVTDARVLPGVSPESQGVIQLNKNRLEARYPELQATATADETAAALARANADKTQRAAAANLATDEAAATAARARTATTNAGAQAVNESLPGVTNRSILGGNVATGVNAANLYPDAGAAGGISDLGVDPNAAFRQSERDFRKMGDELPKEFKKEAIDLAKDAVPKKERKGFTNDDYLTLGLGLLANKSSSFAQALGEAGLGTLKFQKERTKDEREAENDLIKNKYYGALARQADATASSYETGDRLMPQAMAAGNAAYDDWFKSLSPIQQMELKPGQAEAKRQELLQAAMLQFRMKAGTGVAIPEGVKVNRVG